MKQRGLVLMVAFVALAGSACGNPFKRNYVGKLDLTNARTASSYVPHQGDPEMWTSDDQDDAAHGLRQQGYTMMGYSRFNSAPVSAELAKRHARELGAAIVILTSKYSYTESGVFPLVLPTTTTTYHSGIVSSGLDSAYYSGTSRTYGTSTTYIPYSQEHYGYLATYWIKSRPGILGVYVQDLPDEVRQRIGSNRGALVTLVIDDTPAFKADILPGDVILSLNDVRIDDTDMLFAKLREHAGSKVAFTLDRDGVQKTLLVTLNPSTSD